jgi:hypothetical protein
VPQACFQLNLLKEETVPSVVIAPKVVNVVPVMEPLVSVGHVMVNVVPVIVVRADVAIS